MLALMYILAIYIGGSSTHSDGLHYRGLYYGSSSVYNYVFFNVFAMFLVERKCVEICQDD